MKRKYYLSRIQQVGSNECYIMPAMPATPSTPTKLLKSFVRSYAIRPPPWCHIYSSRHNTHIWKSIEWCYWMWTRAEMVKSTELLTFSVYIKLIFDMSWTPKGAACQISISTPLRKLQCCISIKYLFWGEEGPVHIRKWDLRLCNLHSAFINSRSSGCNNGFPFVGGLGLIICRPFIWDNKSTSFIVANVN